MYPIRFVALGPGEAGLITLKSLAALRQADIIYCPATRTKDGLQKSRAQDLLMELGIDPQHICTFIVPMSKDRTAALAAYASLAQEAIHQQTAELHVCIAAEGDAGFYSTTQYISELISREGRAVERTAGVPAFVAAATLSNLHIARGEEELHVVPGVITTDDLLAKIQAGRSVVIMKCSQSAEAIRRAIRLHPDYAWHYYESIGSVDEYHSTNPLDILARTIPYFSIIIVRRERD